MRLADLILDLELRLQGSGDARVTHITHDSRKVEPGSLFVALEGANHDGHAYIGRAAQLGAVAILTNHPERVQVGLPYIIATQPRRAMALLSRRLFNAPDKQLKVIGMTGTNGKTTTCYLLGQLLAGLGCCGRIGTLSYFNGVSEERAHRTTPESSEVYMTLKEMVDNSCAYAAVEISSHAMMFDRVFGMQLAYGIFTNLSRDHLDFHGDMETYFAAKQRMFELLPAGGTAIVNGDDSYGRRLQIPSGVRHLRFGQNDDCDIKIDGVVLTAKHSHFELRIGDIKGVFEIPLLGLHNIYNFVCAATVAHCEGARLEDLQIIGHTLKPIAGRMETVGQGQAFQVVVDFAHSPDALEKVAACCKELCEGRLILVFGAGGDRDKTKRALMGDVADRIADIILVTSDNPRSEDPASIIDMVCEGISRPLADSFQKVTDRFLAIECALKMARQGDMVLIAGKGHEIHQERAGKLIPFSDREVVARILRDMEAGHV